MYVGCPGLLVICDAVEALASGVYAALAGAELKRPQAIRMTNRAVRNL
jgi:hypothetical protein